MMMLNEALASAVADVKEFEIHGHKKGTGGGEWTYATKDDVFRAVRASLLKHKIVFIPEVVEVSHTPKAKPEGYSRIVCKFRFTFSLGEESRSFDFFGEAHNHDQHGIMSALTQGIRHFLINTFLMIDDMAEEWFRLNAPNPEVPKTADEAPQDYESLLRADVARITTEGDAAIFVRWAASHIDSEDEAAVEAYFAKCRAKIRHQFEEDKDATIALILSKIGEQMELENQAQKDEE
jgi:hypothetical protein